MNKYHYIDDQGNISDALPLAALQKIGLPPATKVLIEGGKQWITLAEAMAGGSVISPPPPPPPVAAPAIAAKPAFLADVLGNPLKGALADLKQASADLSRSVEDGLPSQPTIDSSSAKPSGQTTTGSSVKGCMKGCLGVGILAVLIAICSIFLAIRQDAKNAKLPEWQRDIDPNNGGLQIEGDTARLHCKSNSREDSRIRRDCAELIWKAAKSNPSINKLTVTIELTATFKDFYGKDVPKPNILAEIAFDQEELDDWRKIDSITSSAAILKSELLRLKIDTYKVLRK